MPYWPLLLKPAHFWFVAVEMLSRADYPSEEPKAFFAKRESREQRIINRFVQKNQEMLPVRTSNTTKPLSWYEYFGIVLPVV